MFDICIYTIFTVIIFTIIFIISIYIKIYTPAHTQRYGRTALHWAACHGQGGVAEALLKAGCKTDIQDTTV